MVNAGAKALVIAPADSKALVSAVKKAMDQGVVVINIDNRLDPELLKSKGISVPFVGPDNRKGARLVGDYLASRSSRPVTRSASSKACRPPPTPSSAPPASRTPWTPRR
jgi:ABC-type sugar transport system substrate-binding protein